MASLPQLSDQDWEMTLERGAQLSALSADTSPGHGDSPEARASSTEPPAADETPVVTINEDETPPEVTEPSASEEQLQQTVSDQE